MMAMPTLVTTLTCVVVAATLLGYSWLYSTGYRMRQDPAYHAFADTRPLGPIPNAGDVLSNIGFALVGAWGCGRLFSQRRRYAPLGDSKQPASYVRSRQDALFGYFFGIGLISLGSAYYHWAPDNARLVWDRLPMTIGFTTVLCMLVLERIHPAFGSRTAYYSAVALGIGTVFWWIYSEDLLPYMVVQMLPFFLYPVVVLVAPHSSRQPAGTNGWVLLAVVLYALAKYTETNDRAIFLATHQYISGHTLKHLIATLSTAILGRIVLMADNVMPAERKIQ